MSSKVGYHLKEISKGVYGDLSKIKEEYEEFLDSLEQQNPILSLVELSDLIGAIEGYVKKNFNLTLPNLIDMSHATKRAFESGERK